MLFGSRREAGRVLARRLAELDLAGTRVAAIPNGGLAVAEPVGRALGSAVIACPVARAVAPESRSLGIGAVAGWDGARVVSAEIAAVLGLGTEQVELSAAAAAERLLQLNADFSKAKFAAAVEGREIVLVDDCVATGSSMLAGIDLLLEHGARRVLAATPAISAYGYERLLEVTAEVVHLHRCDGAGFSRSFVYPQ